MSLKAFHIFFIVVSVLLTFGFGAWGLYIHFSEDNFGYLAMGLVSLVLGIVLVIYGINFLQKLKHIRYL